MNIFSIWWGFEIKEIYKTCMKIIFFVIWCAPDVHSKLKKYTKSCTKMKVFGICWGLEIKEIYKKLHENCNFWDLMCGVSIYVHRILGWTFRCPRGMRDVAFLELKDGGQPLHHVDHVNHNHQDNRLLNLRVLTVSDHNESFWYLMSFGNQRNI